jgi:hypothetical protein
MLMSASISVDVFLAGSSVSPHTLLIPHPDRTEKRCLTPTEVRDRNFPEARLDPFFSPARDPNRELFESVVSGASQVAYAQPNEYLSLLARSTRGAWAPVRPPCPAFPLGTGIRDLSGNSVPGDLDDYCATARTSRDFAAIPETIPAGSESLGEEFALHNSDLVEHGVLDGEGRLLCDPSHLSYSDQAEAVLAALFDSLEPRVVHEIPQRGI